MNSTYQRNQNTRNNKPSGNSSDNKNVPPPKKRGRPKKPPTRIIAKEFCDDPFSDLDY